VSVMGCFMGLFHRFLLWVSFMGLKSIGLFCRSLL